MPFFFRIKLFKVFSKHGLTILNLCVFALLLGVLIFHFKKKASLAIIIVAIVLGLLLYKHIKKIVILQLLLAGMSLVMIIPKIYFSINLDNKNWTSLPETMLETNLKHKPNIFVIQPDGYVNHSVIDKPPYNYDNSPFYDWLNKEGFTSYPDFRSNYYSTLTSNSSMFAMRHHYYSNTNKSTLKTHKANSVIVGDQNNVLKILKQNGYLTHLITDNSFFLLDRTTLYYDYCNINPNTISYVDTGPVYSANIKRDIATVLDTLSNTSNFFFIEKTIPSHIRYRKRSSKGVEQERKDYFERLELTNEWLKELIGSINEFDKNAMIIIVSDHGGFVGLEYTLEAINKRLNKSETISAFSSLLNIKWPNDINSSNVEFKSNVNLFKKVFYILSENKAFINELDDNSSYLPLKDENGTNFYQYIDDQGNVVFNNISD